MKRLTSGLRGLVESAAGRHGLDPNLVEAIALVESGGDPDAWNPEPKYPYLWNVRKGMPFRRLTPEETISKFPPKDFPCLAGDPDQEWWAQQASWGLMQVMGAVARELKFRKPYLTALCSNPDLNLDIGCAHLAGHVRWAAGDWQRAVRAYNGGRGGADLPMTVPYIEKVVAALTFVKS